MRLGDVANPDAARYGKPLDGVRILAVEQMQALPWATQLLARLGADVVKVEPPGAGDSGRGALPAMADPDGRPVGATFLRNNLNKRSVAINLRSEEGRDLFLDLVPHFDVVAENFKAGAVERLGIGYDAVARRHPAVVYVSVSGFGNLVESPYASWPAYASVAEAMSGIYDYRQDPGLAPVVAPVGALGDIGAALFAVVGMLAALRHRDRTGEGQYVDVAMYDAMVAITDVVTAFWSLGSPATGRAPQLVMHTFKAADGWFVMQVARPHQFERLAALVGHPEWLSDERLAAPAGWGAHIDDLIRPAVETWAAGRGKTELCAELAAAGIAAGPCHTAAEVVDDPHIAARNMLVEVPRSDGVEPPLLVPGNPVKMTKVTEGPESRMPWVGEHTDAVLSAELGLSPADLARLRDANVIA